MKSHMVSDNAGVTRIHLRNKLYSVHAQPHTPLHPDFKSRVMEIAAYVEKNLSSTDHVHYLAELLVRDYGTHYLRSVEVGGIIGQTEFISRKYTEDKLSVSGSVKASASVSFFGKVVAGAGLSATASLTADSQYSSNRTYSLIYTIGGLPYRQNLTIDQWADSIPDNLVIIDRAGNPLHLAINLYTVPELRHETRVAVADTVYEAVKRYFKVNTHEGCTDPKSNNFNYEANVDNGDCDTDATARNYAFGGLFQLNCEPHNMLNQYNYFTHGFSCPNGYMQVMYFILYGCEAYWCVPQPQSDIPRDSGFLFGGFFTETSLNLLTNTMGCPRYFFPLTIGSYLSICVSTEYELGLQYAIPFGGFETCQSGNPLATETFTSDPHQWPHGCPQGYTRYFSAVENSCEINLCIKTGTFKSTSYNELLQPRLPPFHVHTSVELNDTDLLSFIGSDGNVWTRNWFGDWSRADTSLHCHDTTSTTQQGMHTAQTRSTPYTTQSSDNKPLTDDSGSSTVAVTVPTVVFWSIHHNMCSRSNCFFCSPPLQMSPWLQQHATYK